MGAAEAAMAEFVFNLLFVMAVAATVVGVAAALGGALAALWRRLVAAIDGALEFHRARTEEMRREIDAAARLAPVRASRKERR